MKKLILGLLSITLAANLLNAKIQIITAKKEPLKEIPSSLNETIKKKESKKRVLKDNKNKTKKTYSKIKKLKTEMPTEEKKTQTVEGLNEFFKEDVNKIKEGKKKMKKEMSSSGKQKILFDDD